MRFLNPTQTRYRPWREIPESNSNAVSSLTWDSWIQLKRGILDVCVRGVWGAPWACYHFFFFCWALGKSFHPTFESFTFLEQISRKFGKPRNYLANVLPTYLFDMIAYFWGALWWPWWTSTYTATFTFLSEALLSGHIKP
jgi:hypothetical protein